MGAQEDLAAISAYAERLFGDDEEGLRKRDKYVTDHMRGLGYRARLTWEDNDDGDDDADDDDADSGLFPKRKPAKKAPAKAPGNKGKSGSYFGGR